MVDGEHQDSKDRHGELTVLYDGACPLCRREIGLYRRIFLRLERRVRRS